MVLVRTKRGKHLIKSLRKLGDDHEFWRAHLEWFWGGRVTGR